MAGEFDKAKGHVKEAAGDITDDEQLEGEGKIDKTTGKVKDAAESAKDKVSGLADKVRDKIS
jgi:uncharacterized protein YjbJ (UPF0337 family)